MSVGLRPVAHLSELLLGVMSSNSLQCGGAVPVQTERRILAAEAVKTRHSHLNDVAQCESERLSHLCSIREHQNSVKFGIVGQSPEFSHKTGDKFLIYYGNNNETIGRKVGGDSTFTGFHAVTDRDQVCLGWEGRDLPNLRCMEVLLIDGVLHKFQADGALSGRIIEFAAGNTT